MRSRTLHIAGTLSAFLWISSALSQQQGRSNPTSQTRTRSSSGSSTRDNSYTGCIAYRSDGSCSECAAPAYTQRRGTCECASGYRRSAAGTCTPGPCHNRCGQTYIKTANGYCHCDYYCDNHDDCCGGTASKNVLCPSMQPSKNKDYVTNCDGSVNRQTGEQSTRRRVPASTYLPGMCWCDGYCGDAGDCCPTCRMCRSNQAPAVPPRPNRGSGSQNPNAGQTTRAPNAGQRQNRGARRNAGVLTGRRPADALFSIASVPPTDAHSGSSSDVAAAAAATAARPAENFDQGRSKTAVAADSDSALGKEVAAVAAAALTSKRAKIDDCGAHEPYPLTSLTSGNTVGIASVPHNQLDAERQMQDCQAADEVPPANPIVLPLYWTAGKVCRGTSCTGGSYTANLVQEQVDYVNKLYAHVGIQFKWDGEIHTAQAASPFEIDVCLDPTGSCWICQQRRHGDEVAINVMTSPTYVGGTSLGVTLYPSYMATQMMPSCADWVFIYEKTLPGLGGISLIDGGLADSGATLAHEIGHQLMLHHTWYEESAYPRPPIQQQCAYSASMSPADIIAGRSDGVRDTPAQSLNATSNGVTDILRFINCDPQTGAYTNDTAFAQQSCTSVTGFQQGDNYFNNFGNLMSYGDKSCLRTLTPGQGARARCAIKCMRQRLC